MARPVTLSGLEHRLSALTLWGFLGLVSLAGGALMALVTARVEADIKKGRPIGPPFLARQRRD